VAVVAVALTLSTLTGCFAKVVVHDDPGGVACTNRDRWLLADFLGIRGRIDPGLTVAITVSARSTAPNFGGVDASNIGVGISGINPIVVERTTPFHPSICWDPQYPVSLIVRATLLMTPHVQVGDGLSCELSDGRTDGNGGQQVSGNNVTVTMTDLVPGAAEPVQVECRDYYVPTDWTGPLPERPGS
jgi:hypothetical protein